ncbi:MAG: nitroreductase family protein [Leucobacter sp.]
MTEATATRNQTSVPIIDVLADRWSPRSYDPQYSAQEEDLQAIFEAARWAPSAMNSQPWKFIAGARGTAAFEAIAAALVPFNQNWAGRASVLVAALARVSNDGAEQPFARHDVGQAVALLTVEAESRGLNVHQTAGSDEAALRTAFGFGEEYRLATVFAIGKLDHSDAAPEDLLQMDASPRDRRPLDEVVTLSL